MQLVPQNDRIVAVLFHILLDVLHRIDKVDPPADLVEHLVQNKLAGVSGARHNGSRHARGRIRRTVHGRAAFRLQTAQILERLPDVLVRFGHACARLLIAAAAEAAQQRRKRAFRALFVRQVILKLVIGQQDARVRRQTKCIVCLGAAFPPKRRSVASFSARRSSLRLLTSCNKCKKRHIVA